MSRSVIMAALLLALNSCGQPYGQPIRVVIPEGSSMRMAADSLSRAGIISKAKLFRLYGRISGNDRGLKPGTYLLKRGTPWPEIMKALVGGRGLVRSVTVPEGFGLSQITPLLATALTVPPDSVSAAARDTALLRQLGVRTPTLEGYLFPDTYAFPEGTTARRAVAEMVGRFEREWEPDWDARLTQLGRTRHEIVTLASIVEEEAKVSTERPLIAAVYYNRLRINMLLQADPTVQYAKGSHSERVTLKDLEIDSPYNTYRYPGLPPGPIASPGGASLRAALFPATTDNLYFVAYPDGHHEFRRTLEEHNAVRDRIRADTASEAARPQPKQPAKARQ